MRDCIGWTAASPNASGQFARVVGILLIAFATVDSARADDADDERAGFAATFFVGSAIDNFAADDLSRYLNPDASNEPGVFERMIGGVRFAYRLWAGQGGERQLWIHGLTVHGVRSTDVDCASHPDLEVCEGFENETDPSGRFLFIVRNASSLEGAGGFRYEFLQLNSGSGYAASLYAGAQAGFITVAHSDDDLIDVHQAGIGLVATEGLFRESFLELSYGRNDLFERDSTSRKKINAQLVWTPKRAKEKVSGFARILIDTDLDDGADSIQSYFGLSFDLLELFPGGGAVPSS